MSLESAAYSYWHYSKAFKGHSTSHIDPEPMLRLFAVTQRQTRVGRGAEQSLRPLAYSAAPVVPIKPLGGEHA